jgi:glutamine amidotransferase
LIIIGILDYGVGNLFSLGKALERSETTPIIINSEESIKDIDAIIIPGVGSFDAALNNNKGQFFNIVDRVKNGIPVLGICLGLQLFFEESEEGKRKGLGLLSGSVVRISKKLKIPHMGWNTIDIINENQLVENLESGNYVYFVHSYYPLPKRREVVVAETEYGDRMPCIIAFKNIYGTQFHPEKSGKVGQTLLQNFVKIIKR